MQSWVIGRGENCDIRIDDEYASVEHCRVSLRDDGTVTVEDMGSVNGTWVRPGWNEYHGSILLPGLRVYGPVPIRPEWIIRIGRTDIPWSKT